MTFFKINTDQFIFKNLHHPVLIIYQLRPIKVGLIFFPNMWMWKRNERNEIHAPSFYNTFLSIFFIKITINVYFIYFDS